MFSSEKFQYNTVFVCQDVFSLFDLAGSLRYLKSCCYREFPLHLKQKSCIYSKSIDCQNDFKFYIWEKLYLLLPNCKKISEYRFMLSVKHLILFSFHRKLSATARLLVTVNWMKKLNAVICCSRCLLSSLYRCLI